MCMGGVRLEWALLKVLNTVTDLHRMFTETDICIEVTVS